VSRPERVAQRIKFDLSEILRKEVIDPRIGFLTITSVNIASDLKIAKIYVSILGDDKQKKESMQGLASAKNFIKIKLAEKLKMKSMPEITFIFDESIEKAGRIWSLMDKLKKE
jgi:ribosome-binding factor A